MIISPTDKAVESSPSVPSNGMNVDTRRDPSIHQSSPVLHLRFMSHSPPHMPISSDPPGMARLAICQLGYQDSQLRTSFDVIQHCTHVVGLSIAALLPFLFDINGPRSSSRLGMRPLHDELGPSGVERLTTRPRSRLNRLGSAPSALIMLSLFGQF